MVMLRSSKSSRLIKFDQRLESSDIRTLHTEPFRFFQESVNRKAKKKDIVLYCNQRIAYIGHKEQKKSKLLLSVRILFLSIFRNVQLEMQGIFQRVLASSILSIYFTRLFSETKNGECMKQKQHCNRPNEVLNNNYQLCDPRILIHYFIEILLTCDNIVLLRNFQEGIGYLKL